MAVEGFSEYGRFHNSMMGYRVLLKGRFVHRYELYCRGFRDLSQLTGGKTKYELVKNGR